MNIWWYHDVRHCVFSCPINAIVTEPISSSKQVNFVYIMQKCKKTDYTYRQNYMQSCRQFENNMASHWSSITFIIISVYYLNANKRRTFTKEISMFVTWLRFQHAETVCSLKSQNRAATVKEYLADRSHIPSAVARCMTVSSLTLQLISTQTTEHKTSKMQDQHKQISYDVRNILSLEREQFYHMVT